MTRLLMTTALSLCLALPAAADEVEETLAAALDAYRAGDLNEAQEEIAYATGLLQRMQAAGLSAFLPAAPAGWTREIDTDMSAGMAMMGGGAGAEASYSGNGGYFSITLMADNPMVAGMAGSLGAIGMMGGAKRVRINGERFLNNDGELMAIINDRVLIQASGADPDIMVGVLEAMDFDALGNFGR